jgi:LuxR family transcriptional regulator, maltose regulon positive regulatory protein
VSDSTTYSRQDSFFLATKLYIPGSQSELVRRSHLISRLEEGQQRKLTVLSTPAGFGKTTLVVDWIRQSGRAAAWLSLDDGDNDPARFLEYLVRALQTVEVGLGDAVLQMLRSPQSPSFQAALTLLINEVAELNRQVTLVLDDYHLITVQSIHSGLEFILNHLPPTLHLYITTRSDPPIGLSRLRARGELVELRATDLCFSLEETKSFLNEIMGLALTPQDVEILGTRTEGWIVGLKMAAVSMQGSGDAARRIQIFAGDDRYILDYLLEEVLEQQSEKVRNFLLQTSILDRFNHELCDAVTGLAESRAILQYLDNSNLFIVPLDNRRSWYRYHQLFGELLQHVLMREQAELLPDLHGEAARWFMEHDQAEEAIHHAFQARDFETAADLMGQIRLQLSKRGQTATLLKWYRTFPKWFIGSRPLLSIWYSWGLIETGRHHEVEGVLRAAERQISPTIRDEEARFLHGEFAMLRSSVSLEFEELDKTIELCNYAVEQFGDRHPHSRCVLMGNLGIIYEHQGSLERAAEALSESLKLGQVYGTYLNVIWTITFLGVVRIRQGRLREANQIFQQAINIVEEQDLQNLPAIELAYLGMSQLAREAGRYEEALEYADKAIESGRIGKAYWLVASYANLALVQLARNNLEHAERAVQQALEAKQAAGRTFSYRWADWLDLANVRLLLKKGDATGASAYLDNASSNVGALSLRPMPQLLRATVFIVLGRIKDAQAILQPLIAEAKANDWGFVWIEAMRLAALAAFEGGDNKSSQTLLLPLLEAAAREQYVATLLQDSELIEELIPPLLHRDDASIRPLQGYAISLVAAAQTQGEDVVPMAAASGAGGMVTPLSERELQVLRWINDGATNIEIADQLNIAVSTVKTHINNIYGKIGVKNRTQALRLARRLNLI